MKPKQIDFVGLLLIAAAVVVALSGGGLPFAIPGVSKPTAVTYVHDEKAAVPSGVYAALAELNSQGIVATAFPDDATDGDDQVPDQYRIPLEAAKKSGVPSLVVVAGNTVLRVIKSPATKQEVLDAAGHKK